MRTLAKKVIVLYQKTLSPDHGVLKALYPYGCCRYYPTCSEYALEAIDRHGALKGGKIGARRVLRCHPWSQGGIELVPETIEKG